VQQGSANTGWMPSGWQQIPQYDGSWDGPLSISDDWNWLGADLPPNLTF
jgi:hypothetical protein